jgi:hypothetical protein
MSARQLVLTKDDKAVSDVVLFIGSAEGKADGWTTCNGDFVGLYVWMDVGLT